MPQSKDSTKNSITLKGFRIQAEIPLAKDIHKDTNYNGLKHIKYFSTHQREFMGPLWKLIGNQHVILKTLK